MVEGLRDATGVSQAKLWVPIEKPAVYIRWSRDRRGLLESIEAFRTPEGPVDAEPHLFDEHLYRRTRQRITKDFRRALNGYRRLRAHSAVTGTLGGFAHTRQLKAHLAVEGTLGG
eukprot:885503-Prorocentrum_minimum.AAC.1